MTAPEIIALVFGLTFLAVGVSLLITCLICFSTSSQERRYNEPDGIGDKLFNAASAIGLTLESVVFIAQLLYDLYATLVKAERRAEHQTEIKLLIGGVVFIVLGGTLVFSVWG